MCGGWHCAPARTSGFGFVRCCAGHGVRVTCGVFDGRRAAAELSPDGRACEAVKSLDLLLRKRVQSLLHGAAIWEAASGSGYAGNYRFVANRCLCIYAGQRQGKEEGQHLLTERCSCLATRHNTDCNVDLTITRLPTLRCTWGTCFQPKRAKTK
eukprot:502378-Prorocentrum_minimum.AAC.1